MKLYKFKKKLVCLEELENKVKEDVKKEMDRKNLKFENRDIDLIVSVKVEKFKCVCVI